MNCNKCGYDLEQHQYVQLGDKKRSVIKICPEWIEEWI